MKRHSYYDTETITRRKNPFLLRFFYILCLAALLCGLVFASFTFYNSIKLKNSRKADRLSVLWQDRNYEETYSLSKQILNDNPLQPVASIYFGYSAYYLGLSQTDSTIAQTYIDESIRQLRVAKLTAGKTAVPQIAYMLGKAYFQKNALSSYHFYADSVIEYLTFAREKGYSADDIPEYLGLSYASLGMVPESIEAFTQALITRESDALLLAIGEQYLKDGKPQVAKQYLFRVISSSADDTLILKSRHLLAVQYIQEENYQDAVKELNSIIEKDADYADAYYELGVIYEKQGDLVKARAEWRKALKARVNHPGALQKLG